MTDLRDAGQLSAKTVPSDATAPEASRLSSHAFFPAQRAATAAALADAPLPQPPAWKGAPKPGQPPAKVPYTACVTADTTAPGGHDSATTGERPPGASTPATQCAEGASKRAGAAALPGAAAAARAASTAARRSSVAALVGAGRDREGEVMEKKSDSLGAPTAPSTMRTWYPLDEGSPAGMVHMRGAPCRQLGPTSPLFVETPIHCAPPCVGPGQSLAARRLDMACTRAPLSHRSSAGQHGAPYVRVYEGDMVIIKRSPGAFAWLDVGKENHGEDVCWDAANSGNSSREDHMTS